MKRFRLILFLLLEYAYLSACVIGGTALYWVLQVLRFLIYGKAPRPMP